MIRKVSGWVSLLSDTLTIVAASDLGSGPSEGLLSPSDNTVLRERMLWFGELLVTQLQQTNYLLSVSDVQELREGVHSGPK